MNAPISASSSRYLRGRPGVRLLVVMGRCEGNPEKLQLYRSWTRNLLKSKCFSDFRKMQGRSCSKCFAYSELLLHTSCQICGGFHAQLISSEYATYCNVIRREIAGGRRGEQVKVCLWCFDGITTSFRNTYYQ